MERRNNFFSKLFHSRWLILLCLLILVFFSVNLFREVINRQDLRKEISKLQQEISDLEGNNQEMSNLIGYFESLDFVEKEARTKLNLKKPGEKVIIVPETTQEISPETLSSAIAPDNLLAQAEELSNPEKWWQYFFHKK